MPKSSICDGEHMPYLILFVYLDLPFVHHLGSQQTHHLVSSMHHDCYSGSVPCFITNVSTSGNAIDSSNRHSYHVSVQSGLGTDVFTSECGRWITSCFTAVLA